jgi:hypothetical protein
MLAASAIAVFLIPVSFYLVEKFCARKMAMLRVIPKKSLPKKEHPHE